MTTSTPRPGHDRDDDQLGELAHTLARLQRSEARYEASFTKAPIGMVMLGLTGANFGKVLEINEAMVDLTGYRPEEAVGRSAREFVHPDDVDAVLAAADAAARGEIEGIDREIRMVRKDGEAIWVRLRSRRVDDESGERYGIVHLTDITTRRAMEEELAWLALHDPLTGLANRRLLMDRLQLALAGLERAHECVALLYLDLDHFKAVNDTYGHDAGDQVIVEAARRLADTVRSIDTAGRMGGDEFVLVCPALDGVDDAVAVGERIREAFARPIDAGPASVELTVSGGIAVSSDAHANPAALLSAADQALYRAKRNGRNHFELAG